jgi:hypothetical protein
VVSGKIGVLTGRRSSGQRAGNCPVLPRISRWIFILCSMERGDFSVEPREICTDRQVVRQISRGSDWIFARVVEISEKSGQHSSFVHQHATISAGFRGNLINKARNPINKEGEMDSNFRDPYGSAGMFGGTAGDFTGNVGFPYGLHGLLRGNRADPTDNTVDPIGRVARPSGSAGDPIRSRSTAFRADARVTFSYGRK